MLNCQQPQYKAICKASTHAAKHTRAVAVGPCEYGAVETSVDAERDGCRWLEASKGAVTCGAVWLCLRGRAQRARGRHGVRNHILHAAAGGAMAGPAETTEQSDEVRKVGGPENERAPGHVCH